MTHLTKLQLLNKTQILNDAKLDIARNELKVLTDIASDKLQIINELKLTQANLAEQISDTKALFKVSQL